MLTGLRVRNFKAWKDTGEIRLAPITVLFGANSSGKTSLHQLLLMLKQTAQSTDRQRLLHPGDEKTLVDLGTIHDLVHGHDPSARLGFGVEWQPTGGLSVLDVRTETTYTGQSIRFDAEIAQTDGKTPTLVVTDLRYRLGSPKAGGLLVRMAPNAKEKGKYALTAEGYDLGLQQGRAWPLPPPIRFYGFPDEAKVHFQNADFVADLALSLEQMLGAIYYVGPLREYPKPSYTWSGERPDHVGARGQRAVEALLAATERAFNPRAKARRNSFQEVVAGWLQQMKLIDDFKVKPLAEHRKEYEVLVRTAGSRHEVNLTAVGFGVSQVLPVLVECFYVPAGSTIIFEQPEIHLHPSVQAALADLFIEAIQTREGARDRSIQIIIESHSEHFLRRLQRRIAEEALSHDQVALYFCEPAAEGATIQQLDTDIFGNIRNWPKHFFGDEMGDLAAMTEAAMRRKKSRNS